MTIGLSGALKSVTVWMFKILMPLGIWGIAAIALADSALIPVPIDAFFIGYVAHDHSRFLLFTFLAALGSAVGSLVPYYAGRAGGELFLLKRINRQRYEKLRNRFERQEFLAIMIPALLPPPTPIKLFEFAAGVFEMRPLIFALAIFCGKMIRFGAEAILTIRYGPTILRTLTTVMHEHAGYIFAIGGVLIIALIVWIIRKLFDMQKGEPFPVEEQEEQTGTKPLLDQ